MGGGGRGYSELRNLGKRLTDFFFPSLAAKLNIIHCVVIKPVLTAFWIDGYKQDRQSDRRSGGMR